MYTFSRKAFTLIELLVSIGVFVMLAVVTLLLLNPAQLLAQGRDSNRMSDMSSLSIAVEDYQSMVHGSLGSTSTIYISIPDPSATSTAGDQCQGLAGLPTAPAGYTYRCAPTSTYRRIDGTGWIPLKFSSILPTPPVNILPVDPTNTTSSLMYYVYTTDGNTYEVAASLESQKYLKQYLLKSNTDPSRLAAGSNPTLISQEEGLVGYWNFDDGNGIAARDTSGNGNNGTLTCYGTSCSIPTWTLGKVGGNSLQFTGTTGNSGPGSVIEASSGPSGLTRITWMAWIYPTAVSNNQMFLSDLNNNGNYFRIFNSKLLFSLSSLPAQTTLTGNATLGNNQWYFVASEYDGNNMTVYLNGSQDATLNVSTTVQNMTWGGGLNIGVWEAATVSPFIGDIDDVRIYNRPLSAAEIAAIYNAEH